MAPLTPFALNIPNYQNLTIFICHLFMIGNFRTGHILYDPHIFDGRVLTKIGTNCTRSIPWITTDFTKPYSLLWKFDDFTDDILQLIFIDSENLPKSISFMTYYLMFVITSKLGENAENRIVEMGKQTWTIKDNYLVLDITSKDNGMKVYSFPRRHNIKTPYKESIQLQIRSTNFGRRNLFDATFGEIDRNRAFIISYLNPDRCIPDISIIKY